MITHLELDILEWEVKWTLGSITTNKASGSDGIPADLFQILKDDAQEASQVVWYSHLLKNFPQFTVIHTVKGFGTVNKSEVDLFLELSCFFNDPTDVDNLISGSSAFSKTSLNIWKFTVHVLLKADLENFEHYFASM